MLLLVVAGVVAMWVVYIMGMTWLRFYYHAPRAQFWNLPLGYGLPLLALVLGIPAAMFAGAYLGYHARFPWQRPLP